MNESGEPGSEQTADAGAAPAESAPPPGGEQPRAGELFIAAAMITLVAGLVLWGAARPESEPPLDMGTVAPANALDPAAVPSGAFITVSGRPDPARMTPVFSAWPARGQDVLLVLREAPRLVLHCRAKHPLAEIVRRHRPIVPGASPAARELDEAWTFSGRIFDSNHYNDPQLGDSGASLEQFAAEKLKDTGEGPLRVLAVGLTPADVQRSAQTAAFFGAAMALVAIVLWTLAIHGVVRKRSQRRQHEAA